MDENLKKEIIKLAKKRGEIKISEVINYLGLENNRKNREMIRDIFMQIERENKYFKVVLKANAYYLVFDYDLFKKEQEKVFKEIIKESNFLEEVKKRIKLVEEIKIKKYYSKEDETIKEIKEEVKYWILELENGELQKLLILGERFKDLWIIKDEEDYYIVKKSKNVKGNYDFVMYRVNKSLKIILFDKLVEYVKNNRLFLGDIGDYIKIKLIEEKKEDKELEKLKRILEVE